MGKLGQYVIKDGRRLRMGYTTGSCAAAAVKAAATVLLGGGALPVVTLQTPAGILLELDVEQLQQQRDQVTCAIRKDGGDDPDITDGMLIFATVHKAPAGIAIQGGEGIGQVTRTGLSCAAGGPAINPVPMKMIKEALEQVSERFGYAGGLRAVIWAPEGAERAKKTFNSRLGIEDGISILGTSGLVEPMSEKALVETIRLEIDARKAAGKNMLLLTPGNYGRDFARDAYAVSLEAGVKCSNYIGEALDYAVYSGFETIVLLGHAGKLVKLAAGVMNTHSSVADARMEILACHGALAGLKTEQVQRLFDCVTVEAADALLAQWNAADCVWNRIAQRVQFQLDYRLKGLARAAFGAFLNRGVVMQSGELEQLLRKTNKE